jgi:hypothetical protein
MIAELMLPTLFVQEGGYGNMDVGLNARFFLKGFYEEFIRHSLK